MIIKEKKQKMVKQSTITAQKPKSWANLKTAYLKLVIMEHPEIS